jgi:SAM-dependent methyltransferase
VRFADLIPPGGAVLDLACGGGRHTRFLLDRGHAVVAVDVDVSRISDLAGREDLEIICADLEVDGWPVTGRRFDGIVVTNYLYRPLFPRLIESLARGGILIYETFAVGNERFGHPRNPDHLLRPNELIAAFSDHLQVIAYEHGRVEKPYPAVVQRLCAAKPANAAATWPLAAGCFSKVHPKPG